MTNKYFGEFLVEKKLIQSSALIDALICQIEDLPSIPRIIKDEKLLSDDQIMQVFIHQQKNQCEFLSACQTLGFLNQGLISKLESNLKNRRKPLGEILVSLNLLDLKNLTKALDEFLSSAQVPVHAPKIELPKDEIVLEANQSTDDFIEFQPALLMELDEVFNERKKKVIKTALLLIKENTQNDPASAMKLYTDISKIIKSIVSLCEIIGLSNLNQILVLLDKKISSVIQSVKHTGEFNDSLNCYQIINDAIELCWEFRESIISNCSEQKFVTERESDINTIKQKLGQSKYE
jgi:hypothetical protein